MRKIKVIIVAGNLSVGGQERQLIELLKGISEKKYFCSLKLILMNKNIHYNEINKIDICIYYTKYFHRKSISTFFELFKIIKKEKPDIIHSWGPTPACYIFLIAKILRIKYINGFIRNANKPKLLDNYWFRSKLTFPFSDIIVSNSKAGLKSYKVKDNKGKYIYNGFDLNRIKHLEDKEVMKKLFNITTKYIVGMVAAFSEKKDYRTFVSAANIVLDKSKDVTFVAVGDGPNLINCKKLVSFVNKEKIKFLGKQKDIESIVNIFDIGVLATYTEGISNSIMEYMALGKPVIATDGGGTNEIVINNETGFSIEQKNVEQLAEKILSLIENPEKSKEFGITGRNRIIKKFSLETMVGSYIQLYKNILN